MPAYNAAKTIERTYREIRAKGTTDGIRDDLMAFEEFGKAIGLEERYDDDTRFKV